jgi:hypothetical protein
MNRIKQAWLVLIGRAQALEVTQETAVLAGQEAERYGMTVNDLVGSAVELHREMAGPALDQMADELSVINQVNEIDKGVDL